MRINGVCVSSHRFYLMPTFAHDQNMITFATKTEPNYIVLYYGSYQDYRSSDLGR